MIDRLVACWLNHSVVGWLLKLGLLALFAWLGGSLDIWLRFGAWCLGGGLFGWLRVVGVRMFSGCKLVPEWLIIGCWWIGFVVVCLPVRWLLVVKCVCVGCW